jgi:hypothetical protein
MTDALSTPILFVGALVAAVVMPLALSGQTPPVSTPAQVQPTA